MKLDIKTKSKLYKLSELVHKLKIKTIHKQTITFEEVSDIANRLDLITEIFKNYKEEKNKQNGYLKYVAFVKDKTTSNKKQGTSG
jgi:hypothetical protein